MKQLIVQGVLGWLAGCAVALLLFEVADVPHDSRGLVATACAFLGIVGGIVVGAVIEGM